MKTTSKLLLLSGSGIAFAPVMVSAQQIGAPVLQSLGVISQIVGILYGLIPVVAVLVFFAGIAWIIWKKMKGEDFDKGYLIGGLIALAVLFSLYGLIRVLQAVVGASNNTPIPAPAVPRPGR